MVYRKTVNVNKTAPVKKNGLAFGKTTVSEWNKWKHLVRSFYSGTTDITSHRSDENFGSASSSTHGVNTESNMLLVQKEHDNRPYVSVKVFSKEVVALLDTGASHSVFGKEGLQQIHNFGLAICDLEETNINTADGVPQKIIYYR